MNRTRIHFHCRNRVLLCVALMGISINLMAQNKPGVSLDRSGNLRWENVFTNGIVTVESATNPLGSVWLPVVNVFTTNSIGGVSVPLSGTSAFFRLNVADATDWASGTVLVPGGAFQMGDHFNAMYAETNERPAHIVQVDSFFIDRFEVTNEKMRQVFQWAYDHGKVQVVAGSVANYVVNVEGTATLLVTMKGPSWIASVAYFQLNFNNGLFTVDPPEATNYPAVGVSWHGGMAYGNFLSDMQGLDRCVEFTNWTVDLSKNGYRLPTEAEWEKAARGGLTGNVYPWRSQSIAEVDSGRANYTAVGSSHGVFNTKPVGYFDGNNNAPDPNMANGYGLYDMAGNVREWCLDYFDPGWYAQPGATNANPVGPDSGTYRVVRGGSWDWDQNAMRCSYRDQPQIPSEVYWYNGFRAVRRP